MKSYQNYIFHPSIENLTLFVQEVIQSPINTNHLFKIYKNSVPREGILVHSNGSTGKESTPYNIFPPFSIPYIENLIKNNIIPYILITDAFPTAIADKDIQLNEKCTRLQIETRRPNAVVSFIAFLERVLKKTKKIRLDFAPRTLLFLSNSERFVKYIHHRKTKIFLTSSYYEPFFRNTIPVNNQMISWRTGINFFNCIYGYSHFLPIFHFDGEKYYNLINLSSHEGVQDGDFISYANPQTCKCGMIRYDITFLPHRHCLPIKTNGDIFYNPQIASNLLGKYHNFQLYQHNPGEIDLFYTSINNNEYLDHDIAVLEKQNIKIQSIYANTCFRVGAFRKFFSFWNGKIEIERLDENKQIYPNNRSKIL